MRIRARVSAQKNGARPLSEKPPCKTAHRFSFWIHHTAEHCRAQCGLPVGCGGTLAVRAAGCISVRATWRFLTVPRERGRTHVSYVGSATLLFRAVSKPTHSRRAITPSSVTMAVRAVPTLGSWISSAKVFSDHGDLDGSKTAIGVKRVFSNHGVSGSSETIEPERRLRALPPYIKEPPKTPGLPGSASRPALRRREFGP